MRAPARYLVGDVFDRLAEIPDGSVELVLCSPPFLALRSYLPDGHPDKDKEIGSEPTPAAFLDTLLRLTAEFGRVLAPHGSIAIELGDTYAGSGGAGGDYLNAGLREGQPRFDGSSARNRAIDRAATYDGGASDRHDFAKPGTRSRLSAGAGWPQDKSLCFIPQLYGASLAYGRNLLTSEPSPAGMWRVRNVKPWIRSNPPVGALGKKERPATSYVVVACRGRDRWFDLDAVRTNCPDGTHTLGRVASTRGDAGDPPSKPLVNNPAGAPPLDWFHQVDALIDAVIADMAGKVQRGGNTQPGDSVTPGKKPGTGSDALPDAYRRTEGALSVGARGVHIRRALEQAGYVHTLDAMDISPTGYKGAHYACWPKELVRQLVAEMCPRRVCRGCGEPSRRIVATQRRSEKDDHQRVKHANGERPHPGRQDRAPEVGWEMDRQTVGWSDCRCPGEDRWRPGLVLDPFVGSGTTLEVCSGMGRDSLGIDLDYVNAGLALDRVGPLLLDIDWPPADLALSALGPGDPNPAAYDEWRPMLDHVRHQIVEWLLAHMCCALGACTLDDDDPEPAATTARRRNGRVTPEVAGQLGIFTDPEPQEAVP